MQTEQLLCWSGMANTEHTTSGSNKEEEEINDVKAKRNFWYFILI